MKKERRAETNPKKNGLISGFLYGVSEKIYNGLSSGFFGKVFTSYGVLEEEYHRSIFGKLIKKASPRKNIAKPVKMNISRLVNGSAFYGAVKQLFANLIRIKTSKFGMFGFAFGLGCTLIEASKVFFFNYPLFFNRLFFCAAFTLAMIPLMFSNNPLCRDIRESRAASFVFFDFFGAKREAFEKSEIGKSGGTTAFVFGLSYSVLSLIVNPFVLLGAVFAIILIYASLCIPEAGMCLFLLTLPLLPHKVIFPLVFFIFFCWFLKYIRGKRSLKFDALSVCAIFLALSLFLGSIASNSAEKGSLSDSILLIFGFLIFVNLIKSEKWVKKCIGSLVVSCSAFSSVILISDVLTRISDNGFMLRMISRLFDYLPEKTEEANFLIAVFPLVIAECMICDQKASKVFFRICAAINILCLIFEFSLDNTVGICVCLVVFSLFCGKYALPKLFSVICLVISLWLVIPGAWEEYLIKNIFGHGFSDERIINGGILQKLFGNSQTLPVILFFVMILFLFAKCFTAYSDKCNKNCKTITGGCIAGIVALLVGTCFSNLPISGNTVVLLWILIGMCSSVVDSSGKDKMFYGYEELL